MASIKKYTYLEISMKKQQTITIIFLTKFENLAYVSGPFVSVGEDFLFLFKASNVHHKSANGLKK